MDPTSVSTVPFQAPPIRRDMSYRKPVPEYIPSPPSSPIAVTSPDLSRVSGFATFDQPERRALPSLPGGWQDAAIVQEKQIDAVEVALSSDTSLFLRHPSFIQSTPSMLQEDRGRFSSVPTSPNGTKRRLPQIYRPPTPPIGSATRKRKYPEDFSADNHEYLTVPRPGNLIRNAESSGLYPPLSRTATTTAGSSRNSFHPLSTQASFRTEKTAVSDYISGARTNNTSHTDGRRTDDWHDLPVLPMYIVKPPVRRRGSGFTSSTKVDSIKSQNTWLESCRSTFRNAGCALRDAFCCCCSWSS
ncbi:hypothetical protein J3R30DRAFT_2874680 [Lentinula aciculospora]|uniref:Uncharacterized protein n=1 Tax=Lentinula aciculospora TaxID=153920 RepID=A0A9W9DN23_9AGAR|nr:hypothetical protein J3R30DRAFT_2874680 [Lentinula aciculospora]